MKHLYEMKYDMNIILFAEIHLYIYILHFNVQVLLKAVRNLVSFLLPDQCCVEFGFHTTLNI